MKNLNHLYHYLSSSTSEWTEYRILELMKEDTARLNSVLTEEDYFHDTLFHDAAYDLTKDTFATLIKTVDKEKVISGLHTFNTLGKTPLIIAAQYQCSKNFIELIKLMPDNDKNLGSDRDNYFWLLYYTLAYQDKDAVTTLLDKAYRNAEVFEQKMKDEEAATIIYAAGLFQTTDSYLSVINKIGNPYINILMTIKIKEADGNTPLHGAAAYLNTKAFIETINRLDNECLKMALRIKNNLVDTVLHHCMRTQNDASIIALIQRSTDIELNKALLIRNMKLLSPIDILVKYRSMTSVHNLLNRIDIPASNLDSLVETLWFRHKQGEPVFTDETLNDKLHTALSERTKKDDHSDSPAMTVFSHLDNLKKQTVETPSYKTNDLLTQDIKKNNILIKIVAPNRYDDFLEQLCNYTYRPYLRRLKPFSRFKFVHLANMAVPYQRKRREKKHYTHTKKSSMTLIGSHLNTPVFGHQDPYRPLVGYLFKKDECIIKAMFRQDQGTVNHQHLAFTQKEAEISIQNTPDYNYTEDKKFIETVNDETQHTNEVFVKAKREAIAAIVVARMDHASIAIAKQRQEDAYHCLGINVPIVYYNHQAGTLVTLNEPLNPAEHTVFPARLSYMDQYAKTGFKATTLLLGLFVAASYWGEYCTEEFSSSKSFSAEDMFMKIANTLLTPLKKCTDLPDESILPLGAALILHSGTLTGAVAGKMASKKIRP